MSQDTLRSPGTGSAEPSPVLLSRVLPQEASVLARELLQSSAVFFVVINAEGKTAMMNEAMLSSLGYSLEEALQTEYLSTFVHPEDRPRVAALLETRRKMGLPSAGENRVVAKDGRSPYVEWHGRAAFKESGDLDFFVALGIDVTDRKRVETQLKEREQQYRGIFETTTDGLIINDLASGLVVEANPAACQMHGYSYEEMIGLHPRQFIHPEYHQTFADYVETVRRGGSFQVRTVDLRKGGTPFFVEVHGTPFIYMGKPHVLGVIRDVTDQEQSRQLLEQRVEERTRELSTLLEVSHNVASTLDLKPLLGLILDQLQVVVQYTGSSILVLDGDVLTIVDTQEALNNIAKHARAGRVELRLECGPEEITLDIADDGVGFDPAGDFPGHLGLRSMRERVTVRDGTLEIDSAPGNGTRLRARIPTVTR